MPWTAITTAFLLFVICLLVGYILYGAANRIVKVEDDFHAMEELKVRAEAADVAKSQVLFQHKNGSMNTSLLFIMYSYLSISVLIASF